MKAFGAVASEVTPRHRCCDICAQKCNCNVCTMNDIPVAVEEEIRKRLISDDDIILVEAALKDYNHSIKEVTGTLSFKDTHNPKNRNCLYFFLNILLESSISTEYLFKI